MRKITHIHFRDFVGMRLNFTEMEVLSVSLE